MRRCWPIALGGALVLSVSVAAGAAGQDTLGKTTVEQRIVPSNASGFRTLSLAGGEGYTVREEKVGKAKAGRAERRKSLLYVGQLSDFQLADEESPARVEFIDVGPFSAAWRPMEALNPHIDDAMIRQLNAFAGASPVKGADGSRRNMDFTINTGDIADSQQLNETEWSRTLMEGGPLNPNSGVNTPAGYAGLGCLPGLTDEGPAPRYTGVQDFDDYVEGPSPQFWDPDSAIGAFSSFPSYAGLLDRAQQPFTAAGLKVPSYVTFGNHDALVQGNAASNVAYELISTGCIKPMSPVVVDPGTLASALAALDPANLASLLTTDPASVALVPPDPKRQFVSKKQYKDVFRAGTQADGHGFGFVDPAEEAASKGAAGYYAWSPKPGFRFISLDTVSEAGVIGPSADGNIDDPQFRWLERELKQATEKDQLVVIFSHHAIPSLTSFPPDELAGPCLANDGHGHDLNPGCDTDPRNSSPIHLGDDLEGLLHRFPHVVAWVAGHSHVNSIEAYPSPEGRGGFWSIRVAAEADWPQQSRLVEFFDNEDGTISIFGTILDHAAAATAPASGTAAAGLDKGALASIGRTIAYNDTQSGGRACGADPCGEGKASDRNVELLVADPRSGSRPSARACSNKIVGTGGRDRLKGTKRGDRIRARGGADRANGGRARDCIQGGRGNDRLTGGKDRDRISGGGGGDRIRAKDGTRDRIRCGPGRDRVRADRKDRANKSCERVRRR